MTRLEQYNLVGHTVYSGTTQVGKQGIMPVMARLLAPAQQYPYQAHACDTSHVTFSTKTVLHVRNTYHVTLEDGDDDVAEAIAANAELLIYSRAEGPGASPPEECAQQRLTSAGMFTQRHDGETA